MGKKRSNAKIRRRRRIKNMDETTYNALKRIMAEVKYIAEATTSGIKQKDIRQVEDWIDEVAKEYN